MHVHCFLEEVIIINVFGFELVIIWQRTPTVTVKSGSGVATALIANVFMVLLCSKGHD